MSAKARRKTSIKARRKTSAKARRKMSMKEKSPNLCCILHLQHHSGNPKLKSILQGKNKGLEQGVCMHVPATFPYCWFMLHVRVACPF
jgi:hypothetical protein